MFIVDAISTGWESSVLVDLDPGNLTPRQRVVPRRANYPGNGFSLTSDLHGGVQ